jgi:hypothetical protein
MPLRLSFREYRALARLGAPTLSRPHIDRARSTELPDTAPDRAEYGIAPVPQPRMNRSDRWRRRPCVLRYRAFRDEVAALRICLPHRYHAIFVLPMPASWNARKRDAHRGQPHLTVPDVSNLLKALEDAALPAGDSHLWDGRGTKIWGDAGRIVIRRIADQIDPEPFRSR